MVVCVLEAPAQSSPAVSVSRELDPLEQNARRHAETIYKPGSFARHIRDVQDELRHELLNAFSLKRVGSKVTAGKTESFFHSEDGYTSFDVEVYEGSQDSLAWLSMPRSVVVSPQIPGVPRSPPEETAGKFAIGARVNAFVGSGATYAPNLDIELYHWPWCDKLFMYLTLIPRRSLWQPVNENEDDNDDDIWRMYNKRHVGCDETYNELFMTCEQHCSDPKWKQWQRFTSRDPAIRAVCGGNSIIYQMEANTANMEEAARLSKEVYKIWRALTRAGEMPRPMSDCERDALKQADRALLGWPKRDPDAQRAVPLVGQPAVDKMLALLSGNR